MSTIWAKLLQAFSYLMESTESRYSYLVNGQDNGTSPRRLQGKELFQVNILICTVSFMSQKRFFLRWVAWKQQSGQYYILFEQFCESTFGDTGERESSKLGYVCARCTTTVNPPKFINTIGSYIKKCLYSRAAAAWRSRSCTHPTKFANFKSEGDDTPCCSLVSCLYRS